ncbi:MAG: glycosyltransferase family 4 protein [Actinomycetes bacterium]
MSSQPSSVLLVLDKAGAGGMQALVGLLASGLSHAGLEVHVASGGNAAMPEAFENALKEEPSITWHHLADPSGLRGRIRWLSGLARIIRNVRPDIIHGHGMRTAWPCVLIGRRSPHRILVTCHGLDPDALKRTSRMVKFSRVRVGAVGPSLVRDLRQHGVAATLLINGVPPAPTPADKRSLMESFGLDPNLALVVSPARLSPQKDPLTLLAAIAEVPMAALLFVGGGPLNDTVAAAITERGLTGRVGLAGWRHDSRQIIGAATVVAMSSRWEGQALAMLEAAMAGVPLVTTKCPGVIDWLEDGVEALMSPVGDAGALASSLRRVLEDPALRKRLIAGAASVASRHSVDAMVTAHLNEYRAMIR